MSGGVLYTHRRPRFFFSDFIPRIADGIVHTFYIMCALPLLVIPCIPHTLHAMTAKLSYPTPYQLYLYHLSPQPNWLSIPRTILQRDMIYVLANDRPGLHIAKTFGGGEFV